ncbi:MAG: hypothetical protein AB1782_20290 [Cyanobacteriota bacterium]
MTSFSLHQHQLNLIQQMGKYQNSIAEYNLNKVIKYYKDAINSAQTSQEAKGLSESLATILSAHGKALSDVDGLNTNLVNATAGAAGKAGGQKGSAYDKQVIADLSSEFGIDVKKSGTTKDWLEKAKQDQNVRILDKNGKDITNERTGRIKQGDILEVNSKKYGLVKISVGGDGEINGRDDKVISVGGQAAANSMANGLNQINNKPQQNYAANKINPIMNPFSLGITDPTQTGLENANTLQTESMFSDDQIKNLIAAILQQSLFSIQQKEYENYLKQVS